jgi:hypothetical protein
MFVTLNHAVYKNYHCVYTVITILNLRCRLSHSKATNTTAKDSVETDKQLSIKLISLTLWRKYE